MKKQIISPLLAATCLVAIRPAGAASADVPSAADVIAGVVKSTKGPEAGVWVIAETTDLPTRFIKIVVTDDQGRYVLPELPKAHYRIFVRGYGLIESTSVTGAPGVT